MEETGQAAFDVSQQEWVEEVRKMSTKCGEAGLCVKLLFFPDTLVSAIGYQFGVDEREIYIAIQKQSPLGSSSDGIYVPLARAEEGEYRKAVGTEGEMFLSMTWWPCGIEHPLTAELQIATNREFLAFVTNVSRIQ